jgi:hypothetical protein
MSGLPRSRSGQQPLAQPPGYGSSLWAVIAAIVLFALGSLVAVLGVILTVQGLAYQDPGTPGVGGFVAGIGVTVLAFGILHLIVAAAIRAHRAWARRLGIVVGALGALLGAILLRSAFDPPATVSSILSGLSVFPYLVALFGLVISGGHFRTRQA